MTDRIDPPELVGAPHTSAAPFRALIDNLPQCVYLLDTAGRHVAINPPFSRWLGRPEPEILGRTAFDLWPLPVAEQEARDHQRVLRGERLEREEERPGGLQAPFASRKVRTLKVPVRDARGAVESALCLFHESAAARLDAAWRRQVSKMEQLGRLASGVVHDFNNLLSVQSTHLALLEASLPPNEHSGPLLQAMRKAIDQAAALTGRLLALARQQTPIWRRIDVNAVCTEVAGLLKHALPSGVTLDVQQRLDLPPVEGDPSQLTQVLLNLCINACDAMPRGGHLRLETDERPAGAPLSPPHFGGGEGGAGRAGSFVCLTVSDTGEGIPPEVRPRIFEPFFTTKNEGRGTGLGLAIVAEVVEQAGGWVDCVSAPGRGARFTVYWPAAPVESSPSPAPARPPQGPKTILVVEDEPSVRELAQTILQRQGFRVLAAENGSRALDLFRGEQGGIDLVMLDQNLPGLSGRETLNELLALEPHLRVVLVTGGSPLDLAWSAGTPGLRYLGKPYPIDELLETIRDLLAQKGDEGG